MVVGSCGGVLWWGPVVGPWGPGIARCETSCRLGYSNGGPAPETRRIPVARRRAMLRSLSQAWRSTPWPEAPARRRLRR
jgi:hypothetical protein